MIQSVTWWAHSGMAWKSSAAPSLETRSGIFSVKDTNFHLEEALWCSYSSAEVRDLVVTSLWSHQRGRFGSCGTSSHKCHLHVKSCKAMEGGSYQPVTASGMARQL